MDKTEMTKIIKEMIDLKKVILKHFDDNNSRHDKLVQRLKNDIKALEAVINNTLYENELPWITRQLKNMIERNTNHIDESEFFGISLEIQDRWKKNLSSENEAIALALSIIEERT